METNVAPVHREPWNKGKIVSDLSAATVLPSPLSFATRA